MVRLLFSCRDTRCLHRRHVPPKIFLQSFIRLLKISFDCIASLQLETQNIQLLPIALVLLLQPFIIVLTYQALLQILLDLRIVRTLTVQFRHLAPRGSSFFDGFTFGLAPVRPKYNDLNFGELTVPLNSTVEP